MYILLTSPNNLDMLQNLLFKYYSLKLILFDIFVMNEKDFLTHDRLNQISDMFLSYEHWNQGYSYYMNIESAIAIYWYKMVSSFYFMPDQWALHTLLEWNLKDIMPNNAVFVFGFSTICQCDFTLPFPN